MVSNYIKLSTYLKIKKIICTSSVKIILHSNSWLTNLFIRSYVYSYIYLDLTFIMISFYFNFSDLKTGCVPNNGYKLAAGHWHWSPELNIQE